MPSQGKLLLTVWYSKSKKSKLYVGYAVILFKMYLPMSIDILALPTMFLYVLMIMYKTQPNETNLFLSLTFVFEHIANL